MQPSHPEPTLIPGGLEPVLGGDSNGTTGSEPLLGGLRKADADMSRIQALITVASSIERTEILRYIKRLGQDDVYIKELLQVLPVHARQKIGSWHGHFSPTQRALAIDALGTLGGLESIPALIETLTDANLEVRSAAEPAIRAIMGRLAGQRGKARKAYLLLIRSLASPNLSARRVMARLISEADPELVLGPLLKESLDAEDWWTRRETAWVLGNLADKRATSRLIDTLKDQSATVRASAAWALGRLRAPISIPYLITSLTDKDEVVRASAVEALGAQIARLSVLDEEFTPAVKIVIKVMGKDRDYSVRIAALEALAGIDSPEARAALQTMLQTTRPSKQMLSAADYRR